MALRGACIRRALAMPVLAGDTVLPPRDVDRSERGEQATLQHKAARNAEPTLSIVRPDRARGRPGSTTDIIKGLANILADPHRKTFRAAFATGNAAKKRAAISSEAFLWTPKPERL